MRKTVLLGIGAVLSLFFLVLLFRKVDIAQLSAALKLLDWRYLALAVFSTFVSYWLRAVRWRCLLNHDQPISLKVLYPAVIIGYMANNLFPARLGEFIRAWIVAERAHLPGPAVFASLVIDRLIDGLSVLSMLIVVLLLLQLPSGMETTAATMRAAGMTTCLVFAGVIVFLYLLRRFPAKTLHMLSKVFNHFPARLSERIMPLIGSFLEGLHFSIKFTNVIVIFASSVLIWLTATLPIDLILRGFGIQLPLIASFFIMILLVLAVMVPAAPGYVGVYHAACYAGLKAFQVPDTQAISIALIVHGIGFFPVILAGGYHVWADGISLRSVRQKAEQTE